MHAKEKEILEMALVGYRAQIGALQDKIRDVESQLNSQLSPGSEAGPTPVKHRKHRRKFSAESRAKMAAAQRLRWRLLKRQAA